MLLSIPLTILSRAARKPVILRGKKSLATHVLNIRSDSLYLNKIVAKSVYNKRSDVTHPCLSYLMLISEQFLKPCTRPGLSVINKRTLWPTQRNTLQRQYFNRGL